MFGSGGQLVGRVHGGFSSALYLVLSVPFAGLEQGTAVGALGGGANQRQEKLVSDLLIVRVVVAHLVENGLKSTAVLKQYLGLAPMFLDEWVVGAVWIPDLSALPAVVFDLVPNAEVLSVVAFHL